MSWDADHRTLVRVNLSTVTFQSFGSVFDPEPVPHLADTGNPINDGPRSWLSTTRLELSVLIRRELEKHVPGMAALTDRSEAWQNVRNRRQEGVDRELTVDEAP